jgi:hypothetical protein
MAFRAGAIFALVGLVAGFVLLRGGGAPPKSAPSELPPVG